MIVLDAVCKTYRAGGTAKCVADRISAVFPSRAAVALLGANGAGKSTLLRLIAGTQDVDSGRILRQGSISWPVGFGGGLHGDMTAAQTARFVARVQGVDSDELVDYVADFAELGAHFHLPVRTYSAGMKARLAFGLSMGIRFDTYLVDEVSATGDAVFRAKSEAVFRARLADSGLIMVTHSLDMARRLCRHGAVLENGRLTWHDDIGDAIAHHLETARRQMAAA
jgi:capsular polysaccharide transport system ATP-binding protein